MNSLDTFNSIKDKHHTNLNAIGYTHWLWVEEMGWHNTTLLEKLSLVTSEVGEAVNECRGEEPTYDFQYELADIVLRVMDIAADCNIDLYKAIMTKMSTNISKGNYKKRLK